MVTTTIRDKNKMIKPGDIVKVMEHPYSDQTYFVGEVTDVNERELECLTLRRVKGARSIPLDKRCAAFRTPHSNDHDPHDYHRARMRRTPRIQVIKHADFGLQVWRPKVV
jgi:hypothetical protein